MILTLLAWLSLLPTVQLLRKYKRQLKSPHAQWIDHNPMANAITASWAVSMLLTVVAFGMNYVSGNFWLTGLPTLLNMVLIVVAIVHFEIISPKVASKQHSAEE